MTDSGRSLRQLPPVVAFLAVTLGVVVSSAVIAPLLARILPYPFPRILNRTLMAEAVLATLFFVRIRRDALVRFGLRWTSGSATQLLIGFLVGLAGLVSFSVVSVAAGNALLAPRSVGAAAWAWRIVNALLTAALIGVLEELLFRGFLFTWFRDRACRGHLVSAAVVTSGLYAFLHFLHVTQPLVPAAPGIVDSFRLMLAPLQSLAAWSSTWPAAVGLFLFGLVLTLCRIRTGSLYPSIGLHAGCVVFLRVSGLLLRFQPTSGAIWSSKLVYDGVVCWLFLAGAGVLVAALARRGEPRT